MKPIVNRKWRKSSPADHKTFGEKRERDLKNISADDRSFLDKQTYYFHLEEYFGHESPAICSTKQEAANSKYFKDFLDEYFIVDWNQVEKWNKDLFSTKQK